VGLSPRVPRGRPGPGGGFKKKNDFGPRAVRARDPRARYFPKEIAILGRRAASLVYIGRRAAASLYYIYKLYIGRRLERRAAQDGRLVWSEVQYLCCIVKRYETGSAIFYIGKSYISPYVVHPGRPGGTLGRPLARRAPARRRGRVATAAGHRPSLALSYRRVAPHCDAIIRRCPGPGRCAHWARIQAFQGSWSRFRLHAPPASAAAFSHAQRQGSQHSAKALPLSCQPTRPYPYISTHSQLPGEPSGLGHRRGRP
jgi:hypothetical protein